MIEFMLTADGFIENDRSDQLIQVIRLARILSDFSPNVSKTLRRVIALQPLTLVKQKIAEGA